MAECADARPSFTGGKEEVVVKILCQEIIRVGISFLPSQGNAHDQEMNRLADVVLVIFKFDEFGGGDGAKSSAIFWKRVHSSHPGDLF